MSQPKRPRTVRAAATAENWSKIEEMKRRIVARFHPEMIVLFGSFARDTAGPDSDVDLLVVMAISGSKREKIVEIRIVLSDIDVPKDVIVATPDEIKRFGRLVGSILHPALREGRVIYERAV